MRIRSYVNGDARKISNVIRRCLKEVNSKDYSKRTIANLYNFFTPSQIVRNSKDRIIFVAAEGDKIIGTASLKGNTIYTVFVNPDFHGRGIGSKLMSKVEVVARQSGYRKLQVPSSITSVEFYKKLGYKKVKTIRFLERGDTILMEKSI